jgi:hypothetical protein
MRPKESAIAGSVHAGRLVNAANKTALDGSELRRPRLIAGISCSFGNQGFGLMFYAKLSNCSEAFNEALAPGASSIFLASVYFRFCVYCACATYGRSTYPFS